MTLLEALENVHIHTYVHFLYLQVICSCKMELLHIKSTPMHQIMGFKYDEFNEAVELAEK